MMKEGKEMYGAVRWINDHPFIDGMKAFSTKEKCLECINRMETMDKIIEEDDNFLQAVGVKSEWRIVRIEVADDEV